MDESRQQTSRWAQGLIITYPFYLLEKAKVASQLQDLTFQALRTSVYYRICVGSFHTRLEAGKKLCVKLLLLCFLFETRIHYVVQAGVKLEAVCLLGLPGARITGVYYHTRFGVVLQERDYTCYQRKRK